MDSEISSFRNSQMTPERKLRRIDGPTAVAMVVITVGLLVSVFAMIRVDLTADGTASSALKAWAAFVAVLVLVDVWLLVKIRNPSRRH